jgi:Domain of unknown function (DUF4349)
MTTIRLTARLPAIGLTAIVLALFVFAWARSERMGQAIHSASMELRTFDVAEEPPPPVLADGSAQSGASAAVAVATPRIAYTYGYSFRLDAAAIASVQERHLALCRRLGPALCRVTAMQRGEGHGDAAASLNLQVAAPLAERFGRALTTISTDAGAETVDRRIEAEDLSRQMIDSAARIRTRETLIRRLTLLLETRSGNIQQAVGAERAINTAQEELEAARAWLAEMQGRVAMSAIEIGYQDRPAAAAPVSPIGDSLHQVGALATTSIGAMILLAGVAAPWLLLVVLIVLLVRAIRRRFPQTTEE